MLGRTTALATLLTIVVIVSVVNEKTILCQDDTWPLCTYLSKTIIFVINMCAYQSVHFSEFEIKSYKDVLSIYSKCDLVYVRIRTDSSINVLCKLQ